MSIDFSELALSPNESRAARNFFGLSQAQAADHSKLPAHKLKRFETGNYVPDGAFLKELRTFFEDQGYNFHDEDAPGAKAKARGDVFPAGVVGKTSGSPSENAGKLNRPEPVNLQFMRISPLISGDQIDRIFDCIENNEAAIQGDLSERPVTLGFLTSFPDDLCQARAVFLMRKLAENGLLYARLMGRDLLPAAQGDFNLKVASAKTVGELVRLAMSDMQLAVLDADKDALLRRKTPKAPKEVIQALVA